MSFYFYLLICRKDKEIFLNCKENLSFFFYLVTDFQLQHKIKPEKAFVFSCINDYFYA